MFAASLNAQTLKADLVVVNANVRTMDKANARAEAFAVLGGKIAAVGSTAEIKQLSGANTRTIDAEGRLVLPGFNDAHVHFMDGGAGLSSVDLRDAKTPQEFVE